MSDLSTRVLVEIRDEMRGMRGELTARLDQTNAILDQTNEKLAVLAHITQSIDGRVERLEERDLTGCFSRNVSVAWSSGLKPLRRTTMKAEAKNRLWRR